MEPLPEGALGAPHKTVEIVYQNNPLQVILYTDSSGVLWCTARARDATASLTLEDGRVFAEGLLAAIDKEIATGAGSLEEEGGFRHGIV